MISFLNIKGNKHIIDKKVNIMRLLLISPLTIELTKTTKKHFTTKNKFEHFNLTPRYLYSDYYTPKR